MPLDRDRLIKLLNVTTSEHDAEALSAIRRANVLLRQSKSMWADIVAMEPAVSMPVSEPSPEPAPADADLFGEEPILVTPSHGGPARKDKASKDAVKARIRAVPALWRFLFFPIWAFAEAYVAGVYREPWPIKAPAFAASVAVLGLAGAMWVAIVRGIAQAVGVDL